MNIPKVSVIIPVYNTEKYIGETLNSIINQTLKEIEIIVINDGSTDNSLQIINEYARIDNRIIVYAQENQGQSIARNKGFDHASGNYIYFMDSDDFLDLNALELCYIKSEENKIDFIFFDADTIYESNQSDFQMNYHHVNICDKIYNGIFLINYLLDTNQFFVPPYLNFIRKAYLDKHILRFHPQIIHEDQLFTFNLYIHAQKVSYIPKPLFKRRIRSNSTMTKKFSLKNMNGYFTVSREILKYKSGGTDKLKKTIDLFLFQMLNATSYGASTLPFNERMYVLRELIFKYFKYISIKSLARILFN